jgi:hypothetical protein
MTVRRTVLVIVTALWMGLTGAETRAESPVIEKIVALNKGAITALTAGDHEKAKGQLMEAVVLGKENGLGMHAAMARTYLHLGVLYTDGMKDKEKALRNFALALKVRSDIELTPSLASKTVVAAFAEAKGEKPGAAPAAPAPAPAVDKKKEEAEARAREKAAREAKEAAEKADKALAQSRDGEKKERSERERLQKELAEKDKQLADKAKLLAEKDKSLAEKDKQLADRAKQLAEKDKQLADVTGREKKEHEARERFEKLSQENAKLIAEATAREKKERDAREKLEKDRLAAETREKERKDHEAQARAARERQLEGPDLPANIPQALYCPTRDEAVVGQELFVHCAPQADVKAKALVLFYRPSGVAHFNSLTMERSKKGWWTAAVPANRVAGKTLQYYVEARGAKDEVAAAFGKAGSPNLVLLKASAAELSKPASDPVALSKPAAKGAGKAPAKAARRTPAALRRAKAKN